MRVRPNNLPGDKKDYGGEDYVEYDDVNEGKNLKNKNKNARYVPTSTTKTTIMAKRTKYN